MGQALISHLCTCKLHSSTTVGLQLCESAAGPSWRHLMPALNDPIPPPWGQGWTPGEQYPPTPSKPADSTTYSKYNKNVAQTFLYFIEEKHYKQQKSPKLLIKNLNICSLKNLYGTTSIGEEEEGGRNKFRVISRASKG